MFAPFSSRALRATILAAIAATGAAAVPAPALAASPLVLTQLPVNPDTLDSVGNDQLRDQNAVRIGSETYFVATVGDTTGQVWKTDGTTAGTVLVKDFFPAGAFGEVRLAKVGSSLVVTPSYETDTGSVNEIWISDGTAAGTVKLEVSGGVRWTTIESQVASLDGTLYFAAQPDGGSKRLWSVDPQTHAVTQVDTTVDGVSDGAPVLAGGAVYFVHWVDGSDTGELKRVGASGPVPVLDAPGGDPIATFSGDLVAGGDGRVFFQNPSGFLAATDGAGGLDVVSLGETGYSGMPSSNYTTATPTGIVFTTFDYRSALVTVDGTTATSDHFNGLEVSAGWAPLYVAGRYYAVMWRNGVGLQLFTKTTPGATATPVVDGDGSEFQALSSVVSAGGEQYLLGVSPNQHVPTLYRLDGAVATTVHAFTDEPNVDTLTAVGGQLLLTNQSPSTGAEPWVSDGTSEGTHLLKDINDVNQSSHPTQTVTFAGKAWFGGYERTHGNELWTTDGTASGTHLFADLLPGADGSSPEPHLAAGGKLYFSASANSGRHRLYVTDGTIDGITPLSTAGGDPVAGAHDFVAVGDTVYFVGSDIGGRDALFQSGGTSASTVQVDLPIPGDARVSRMAAPILRNGKLFVATVAGSSVQVFSITAGGAPVRVLDSDGLGSLMNDTLYPFGDGVAFGVGAGEVVDHLVTSDGTVAGTAPLDGPGAASVASNGASLVPFGSGALFYDGNGALSVLHPDGSATPIAFPDGIRAFGAPTVNTAGTALVAATDCLAATGRSLCRDWVYAIAPDGTPAELAAFYDVTWRGIALVDGLFYFAATADAAEGQQLFQSDGTVAGTKVALDLVPGIGNTFAAPLGSVGDAKLFFGIRAGEAQLFSLTPAPEPTPTATPAPTPTEAPAPPATPAPVAPTPAPVAGPAAPTRITPVDLRTIVTKRGLPNTYRISGTLALPAAPKAAACEGTVTIVVKIAHKTALTKTASLKKGAKGCTYSRTIRLAAATANASRRVRVKFDGNAAVLPTEGRSVVIPR
jgi:ELWxxDGT repeat protein